MSASKLYSKMPTRDGAVTLGQGKTALSERVRINYGPLVWGNFKMAEQDRPVLDVRPGDADGLRRWLDRHRNGHSNRKWFVISERALRHGDIETAWRAAFLGLAHGDEHLSEMIRLLSLSDEESTQDLLIDALDMVLQSREMPEDLCVECDRALPRGGIVHTVSPGSLCEPCHIRLYGSANVEAVGAVVVIAIAFFGLFVVLRPAGTTLWTFDGSMSTLVFGTLGVSVALWVATVVGITFARQLRNEARWRRKQATETLAARTLDERRTKAKLKASWEVIDAYREVMESRPEGTFFSRESELPFPKDRIRAALVEVSQHPLYRIFGQMPAKAAEIFLLILDTYLPDAELQPTSDLFDRTLASGRSGAVDTLLTLLRSAPEVRVRAILAVLRVLKAGHPLNPAERTA